MELHIDITGDDKVVSQVLEKMMGVTETQESTTGGARNARRTHANTHSMHANTRNTESYTGRTEAETPPGPSEEERSGR